MKISITSQVGGPDAKAASRSAIRQLAIILRDLEDVENIIDLDDLKLRTRVGGEIEDYKERTGVHNVKVLKRYGYATAEVIIQQKDLTEQDDFHILYKKLLAQALDELKTLLDKKEMLIDPEKYDKAIRDAILKGMQH